MIELWDVLDENGNKTGRLHERGWMKDNEYHLVVHVWIINKKGEFLISKRTLNKTYPGMWECTGGSAVAGDDSLTTALKETREELGIILKEQNGELFKRHKRIYANNCGDFLDVWIFRQEVKLTDVKFQPEETCDAMLATKEEIEQMIDTKQFIGRDIFPYLDEFWEFCKAK